MNANKTAAKSQGSERVSESWDQLSEQIDRLRDDIGMINASVSGLAKASVTEGRDRVMEQLDELAQRTRDLTGTVHARGRRAARDVGEQAGLLTRDMEASINRNPLTAMLIALGLGFIIGLSTRGRG